MTDTARTLSALKALLADNTTGQISAQDVRDLLESVANPVAGGGIGLARSGQGCVYRWGDVSVPDNAWTGVGTLTPNVVPDPLALLGGQSYSSTYAGSVFGAEEWLGITPGLWMTAMLAGWTANTTGERLAYLGVIDDRITTTDIDPVWFADGYYADQYIGEMRMPATSLKNGNKDQSWEHLLLITEEMAGADGFVRFAPQARQSSGGPLTFEAGSLMVQKLSA